MNSFCNPKESDPMLLRVNCVIVSALLFLFSLLFVCVCVYVIYFYNVFSCGAKEKKSTFTLGLGCFMVAYD